jgi:hypothetical protein
MMKRSISAIGSFRKHNQEIQHVCSLLRAIGAFVNSPQGSEVIEPGVDFVRFQTDSESSSDAAIQSLALHRILRSDLVYAVLPGGYIGRTTCYEVGRVLQSRRPIYFSERPLDFPIQIPDEFIVEASQMAALVGDPSWVPKWLYADEITEEAVLEVRLIEGNFVYE